MILHAGWIPPGKKYSDIVAVSILQTSGDESLCVAQGLELGGIRFWVKTDLLLDKTPHFFAATLHPAFYLMDENQQRDLIVKHHADRMRLQDEKRKLEAEKKKKKMPKVSKKQKSPSMDDLNQLLEQKMLELGKKR